MAISVGRNRGSRYPRSAGSSDQVAEVPALPVSPRGSIETRRASARPRTARRTSIGNARPALSSIAAASRTREIWPRTARSCPGQDPRTSSAWCAGPTLHLLQRRSQGVSCRSESSCPRVSPSLILEQLFESTRRCCAREAAGRCRGGSGTPVRYTFTMNSTERPIPPGTLAAIGAIAIGAMYGAGLRSWKLAAVVTAAAGLAGLDLAISWRD